MTAEVLQPRLAVIRRLYLYTVVFGSLCTIHVNLRILARQLTYVWIGLSDDWIGPISYHSGATDNVSLYSASLLVALVFFVLHWILIQRFLVRDRTERQSSLRHFFMWACLVLNIYWFGAGLADFLYVPLQHLTGQMAVPSREELLFLPPLTLQFAMAALCVARFARICISERHPGQNSKVQSMAAVFQFAVQFIFLFVVVWYLRRLIYILFEPFDYDTVKQIPWSSFSGYLATVLSALAILIWLHRMCRTWRHHTRTTLSAAFHLGYLQAGMLLGVILAVMSHRYSAAPLLLRSFLSSRDAHWDNVYLLADLAVVALGLACWQVHAWLSRRSPERKRAAEWGFALPRFRDYVLALVGLALLGSEVFFILHEDILPVLHRGLGFIVATRHFLNSILDSGGILTSVLLLVATWLTVARHERSRPHSVLEVIPQRIYSMVRTVLSRLGAPFSA